jgi:hypothetical protein
LIWFPNGSVLAFHDVIAARSVASSAAVPKVPGPLPGVRGHRAGEAPSTVRARRVTR